ncbi:MAG: hypothetical protein ACSHYB_14315 [Roseibacillus sp.]
MSLKGNILGKTLIKLREEYGALEKALNASSAAATDPDSKAEGKYDTRSLEMSYLAAGQAQQAETLQVAIAQLERFEVREFLITDAIDLGARVELEKEGEWVHYLLLPVGGGIEVEEDGMVVTTLTTESPLFARLKGKRIGEDVGGGLTVSEVG